MLSDLGLVNKMGLMSKFNEFQSVDALQQPPIDACA